jgi:endoglucanase
MKFETLRPWVLVVAGLAACSGDPGSNFSATVPKKPPSDDGGGGSSGGSGSTSSSSSSGSGFGTCAATCTVDADCQTVCASGTQQLGSWCCVGAACISSAIPCQAAGSSGGTGSGGSSGAAGSSSGSGGGSGGSSGGSGGSSGSGSSGGSGSGSSSGSAGDAGAGDAGACHAGITCATLGFKCGTAIDACGATHHCGTCKSPLTCTSATGGVCK